MTITELMRSPYGTTDTYVDLRPFPLKVGARFRAVHRERVIASLVPKTAIFYGKTPDEARERAEEYDRKLKEGRNNANAAIKRRD
jgi:hypothetical protein